MPTASMLRGCSRARNQNPGIFLVCRGHLHPEVWRRRSQARLRRRLCCRERNGCSEWLKSCGKHSRRSKISAGFNAIWRSRVNRLSRRNRSRVGFRLEGTAVFSGPNSVYKQHRLCDKQSHENKFGDWPKGKRLNTFRLHANAPKLPHPIRRLLSRPLGAGAPEWAVATSRRYLPASCWAMIA